MLSVDFVNISAAHYYAAVYRNETCPSQFEEFHNFGVIIGTTEAD